MRTRATLILVATVLLLGACGFLRSVVGGEADPNTRIDDHKPAEFPSSDQVALDLSGKIDAVRRTVDLKASAVNEELDGIKKKLEDVLRIGGVRENSEQETSTWERLKRLDKTVQGLTKSSDSLRGTAQVLNSAATSLHETTSSLTTLNKGIEEEQQFIKSRNDAMVKVLEPLNELLTDQKNLLTAISGSVEKLAAGTACSPLTAKDKVIAGTFIVSLLGFVVSTFRQVHYKRVDTMLEFQKRFHELFYKSDSKGDQSKLHNWLYWSLQHQQFATWRRGLLPHTTYHFWMARRVLEQANVKDTDEELGLTGWDKHKSYFANTHYYDFMNDLLKHGKIEDVVKAREHAKQTLWKHSFPTTKIRFIAKLFYPEGPIYFMSETWPRLIGGLLLLCVILATSLSFLSWLLSCTA